MKIYFSIFLLLLFISDSIGQISRCQNIYIWDFTDDRGQKTEYTRDLTNAVEEAFVNINECSVLQRRNFATLQSQIEIESSVQSSREIKNDIKQNLSTIGAEIVIFGVLTIISKREFELRLRIENLKTTKIISVRSIDIDLNDLLDNGRKRELIKDAVAIMIGKVSLNPSLPEKFNGTIKNCLNGYTFKILSCKGNNTDQTVILSIQIMHELANQSFYIQEYRSKSYGNMQEFDTQYATIGNAKGYGSTIENSIPTLIPMIMNVHFRNVLPNVTKLDRAILNLGTSNKNGGGNSFNCEIEISNIQIQR